MLKRILATQEQKTAPLVEDSAFFFDNDRIFSIQSRKELLANKLEEIVAYTNELQNYYVSLHQDQSEKSLIALFSDISEKLDLCTQDKILYQGIITNTDKLIFSFGLRIRNLFTITKSELQNTLQYLKNYIAECNKILTNLTLIINDLHHIYKINNILPFIQDTHITEYIAQANAIQQKIFQLYLQLYLHAKKINYIYSFYFKQSLALPYITREDLTDQQKFYYDVLRENNHYLFKP